MILTRDDRHACTLTLNQSKSKTAFRKELFNALTEEIISA